MDEKEAQKQVNPWLARILSWTIAAGLGWLATRVGIARESLDLTWVAPASIALAGVGSFYVAHGLNKLYHYLTKTPED